MANTISRYQPQSTGVTRLPDLVNQLFNESFVAPSLFDRSFAGGTTRPSLPVNLWETTDGYVMQAALPGMSADNLDIQVTGREVSVRGKLEVTSPENGTWIWQGIPGGEFFETYTLPAEIESDAVENIKVNVTK
jgi:HSP20 family protein